MSNSPIPKSIPKKQTIDQEEKKREKSVTTKTCETVHYKQDGIEYEGSLLLDDKKITLTLAKTLEAYHWEEEFSMQKLTEFDKNWLSLLDEEIVFGFIFESFRHSDALFTENDDGTLKVEFKYQLGYVDILLPIIMKKGKMDVNQTIIKQASLIKGLIQEKEVMQKTIADLKEELKLCKRDVFVLLKENDGINPSTYSSSFVDVAGVKSGQITIRRKCRVKWSLHLNGLYFNNATAGYTASFRLELTNAAGAKSYWPSDKGCTYVPYIAAGSYITSSYSNEDVTELDEGKYSIKIQWAYSGNSKSYYMYYYHTYCPMKLIIETY